MPRQPS